MTERSEGWDKKEAEFSKGFSPDMKKLLIKILAIYHKHSKTCNWIRCKVSFEGEITKLECGECGWSYLKPWWRFWK